MVVDRNFLTPTEEAALFDPTKKRKTQRQLDIEREFRERTAQFTAEGEEITQPPELFFDLETMLEEQVSKLLAFGVIEKGDIDWQKVSQLGIEEVKRFRSEATRFLELEQQFGEQTRFLERQAEMRGEGVRAFEARKRAERPRVSRPGRPEPLPPGTIEDITSGFKTSETRRLLSGLLPGDVFEEVFDLVGAEAAQAERIDETLLGAYEAAISNAERFTALSEQRQRLESLLNMARPGAKVVIQEQIEQTTSQLNGMLVSLISAGPTPQTLLTLESIGIDIAQADEIFGIRDMFQAVFPDDTMEEVIRQAEENPDVFFAALMQGERTQDVQDLLNLFGIAEAEQSFQYQARYGAGIHYPEAPFGFGVKSTEAQQFGWFKGDTFYPDVPTTKAPKDVKDNWIYGTIGEFHKSIGVEPYRPDDRILTQYHQRRLKEATGVERAVISPLFRVGDVDISASDLVALGLIGLGAYVGLRGPVTSIVNRIKRMRAIKAEDTRLKSVSDQASMVMMEELEAVLRANPELAIRATPQMRAQIADGMVKILRARAQAGPQISARLGLTGVPEAEVGGAFERQAARSFAKFALEWGSPRKPSSVVNVLRTGGFTQAEIQGMSVETAWNSLTSQLTTIGALELLGVTAPITAEAPTASLNAIADKIISQTPLTPEETQIRANNAQAVEDILTARVTPTEPAVAPEGDIIEQLRSTFQVTNVADETLAVLPDGVSLTSPELSGRQMGAFQHLIEGLPPTQEWLNAGVARIAWEEGNVLNIELAGEITQAQFNTLNRLMNEASSVNVDFTDAFGNVVNTIEGTPNIVRSQLREVVESPPVKAAVPEVAPEVVPLEPWKMTISEYLREFPPKFAYERTPAIRRANLRRNEVARAKHKALVEQAVFEGKPVSSEVLAEYPDLQSIVLQVPGEPEAGLEGDVEQLSGELKGLKATLEQDPVAQAKFKMGGRNVDLTAFISIREQNFPETFTVKQAQALFPRHEFTNLTPAGRVPRDAALDELTKEFNMTPDEIADRVMQIRQERARIKELTKQIRVAESLTLEVAPDVEILQPIATTEQEVALLAEEVKAKLEAQEAYEAKTASVEAEMEANRKNNLEAVTAPRQEGEIPRQTVRHPSHYRDIEDFNVEVKKEMLTGIPESPLDVAATEYLKSGDFSKYIEAMPDVGELKLAALTGEVHTAVEELTSARQLAVEELISLREKKAEALEIAYAKETVEMWDMLIAEAGAKQDLFGGLIEKAKAKKALTIDDAVALGIALRRTKGGKLIAAVRRSGFYVTEEFVASPYLQNVSYQSGFWQDIDTLFESIDGGRAAGTPDAPAVAQKYIQRPSQRNFLAYKRFLDTYFQQAQERFEQFELTGRISKQQWSDIFGTIEQITAKEADFKTAQLLRKTEIRDLLAKYDAETRTNIVEFAQWSRAFLDEMRDFQNQARAKRGQKEIGYIDKYMAWVAESNIWSRLGFEKRTPSDMQVQAPAPDYIFPDAPFNARAMTREGGMRNYTLEKNVHKLIFDYIRTAGKDIFFTNTVQNNKIHIAALKAKGLNSTAQLLEEYNAEVWSGVKPRLTKAYEAFLPAKVAKATYLIRRQLTRAVFPLNWLWNIQIQPSSIAFTVGRVGFINTFKGLDFLYRPSARAFTADSYSYIIKSKRAGKMAFQDIGQQVEQSLRFEGSLIDKAEFYASFITNTIESLLTGVSIRAGYYKGTQLGFKGQELVEYASKMGAKTQSMYNFENVPAVLRSKAVGALFPFQTFTIQAMNYVREMNFIRVGRAGAYETISATSARGKATISQRLILTTSFLMTILVINAMMDKFTNRKPWILSSFIPMFSILGAGFEPGDAWNLPLPIKYVNDFWRGFNDAIKYDDITRLRRWVLTYHFPFGGSQINRMIDGAVAVSRGVVTDIRGQEKFEVHKDEWLKAIFMGPYHTEGGREYIDRLDEKKERKAKWYEYLDLPILIGRVDINSEIDDNLAKLGEIDEDGMRYDYGDFASAIREIRRSVGINRFDKSVSPILDGFKDAESSREHFESLPPEKLINMDEFEIAGFLFPEEDEKDVDITALWTRFNTAETKEGRLDIINEYIETNKETLKDNKLVENYGLLEDYWSLIGKDKEAFAKKYDVLTKNWRSDWRRENPRDDALLAMWDYGGKIQTQEAYNFIKKWSEEYGVDLAHLSTWLPPEGSEENYFKYQEAVLEHSWNSAEAQLILAKDAKLSEALGLDAPEFPERYYELKVKNRAEREYWGTLTKKSSDDYIEDIDERHAAFFEKFPNSEYFDDDERTEAIAKGFNDEQVEEWVARGRLVDEYSGGSPKVKEWAFDNPDAYAKAIEEGLIEDRGGLPEEDRGHYDEWVEPAIRLKASQVEEDARWKELGDKGHDDYIKDDDERMEAFLEEFPDSPYFANLKTINAYEAGFTHAEAKLWAEKLPIVDETSPLSAEVKLWYADHRDIYDKAKEAGLVTSDIEEWNIPALRIDVQWRQQDEEYKAIDSKAKNPDTGVLLTDEYLDANEAYRRARRRRDALKVGYLETEAVTYADYWEEKRKGGQYGERFLIANESFMEIYNVLSDPDVELTFKDGRWWHDKTPIKPARYDELKEQNPEAYFMYDAFADNDSRFFKDDVTEDEFGKTARDYAQESLNWTSDGAELSKYWHAKTERAALERDKLIDAEWMTQYIGWEKVKKLTTGASNQTSEYFEDKWYLLETPGLLGYLKGKGLIKEGAINWEKVPLDKNGMPDRATGDLWDAYWHRIPDPNNPGETKLALSSVERDSLRLFNDSLDALGIAMGRWDKPMKEQKGGFTVLRDENGRAYTTVRIGDLAAQAAADAKAALAEEKRIDAEERRAKKREVLADVGTSDVERATFK